MFNKFEALNHRPSYGEDYSPHDSKYFPQVENEVWEVLCPESSAQISIVGQIVGIESARQMLLEIRRRVEKLTSESSNKKELWEVKKLLCEAEVTLIKEETHLQKRYKKVCFRIC